MNRIAAHTSSFVATLMASLFLTSAAYAMPVGAIFFSEFDEYETDWFTRDTAPGPTIVQLAESAEVGVAQGQGYAHFDTVTRTSLNRALIDDLEISMILDGIGAGGASLRISWFSNDDNASFLSSERVFYVRPGTSVGEDEMFARAFSELVIPEAASFFELNAFVWGEGGIGVFDDIAVAPTISGIVPEPGTAMLLGLGLMTMAGARKRA